MSTLAKIGERLKVLTDPRYRSFYAQRRVTDVPARERRAADRARALPQPGAALTGTDRDRAAQLDRDGFAMLDGVFPTSWFGELYAHLSQKPCADPYRDLPPFIGPQNAPKGSHVAFFPDETVVAAPHVFEIANHPSVIAPVAAMLGAKPTASYMAAWWSIPTDGVAKHAENFHRDVDDLKFVKLFCYLTDVDEDSGPHVYVPGSHRVNKLTTIRRYADEEVRDAFGPDCEKRFVGPAGTAFLENTYGFHRGLPPRSKPRMIFQVLYSLEPVIYGPKRPVTRVGAPGVPAGLDPYINRVYCQTA